MSIQSKILNKLIPPKMFEKLPPKTQEHVKNISKAIVSRAASSGGAILKPSTNLVPEPNKPIGSSGSSSNAFVGPPAPEGSIVVEGTTVVPSKQTVRPGYRSPLDPRNIVHGLVERRQALTVTPSNPEPISRLRSEFKTTGTVPSWYKITSGRAPGSFRELGLSDEFYYYTYGASIGRWTGEDVNKTLNTIYSQSITPRFVERHFKEYSDTGMTWEQYHKKNPTLFITGSKGNVNIVEDTLRWQKEQHSRAVREKDYGFLVGETLSSIFSPERIDYAIESLRSGTYDPKTGTVSVGGEKVNFMGSGSSILASGHYTDYKAFSEKDYGKLAGRFIGGVGGIVIASATAGAVYNAIGYTGLGVKTFGIGSRAITGTGLVRSGITSFYLGSGAVGMAQAYQQGGLRSVEEQIKRAGFMSPAIIGAWQTGAGYGGQLAYKGYNFMSDLKSTYSMVKGRTPILGYISREIGSYPIRSSNAYWNRQMMLRDRSMAIRYGEQNPGIREYMKYGVTKVKQPFKTLSSNFNQATRYVSERVLEPNKIRVTREFGYRYTTDIYGNTLIEKIQSPKQIKLFETPKPLIGTKYKSMTFYGLPAEPLGEIPIFKSNSWRQLFPPGTGERYDFMNPEYKLTEPTIYKTSRFYGQNELVQSNIDTGTIKPVVTIKSKPMFFSMEAYNLPSEPMIEPSSVKPNIWKQLFPYGTGESMMVEKYNNINKQVINKFSNISKTTNNLKIKTIETVNPQGTLDITFYGETKNVIKNFKPKNQLRFFKSIKDINLPDSIIDIEHYKPVSNKNLFALMEKPYNINPVSFEKIDISQYEWYQQPTPTMDFKIKIGRGNTGGYAAAYGYINPADFDYSYDTYVHPRWNIPAKDIKLNTSSIINYDKTPNNISANTLSFKPINTTGYINNSLHVQGNIVSNMPRVDIRVSQEPVTRKVVKSAMASLQALETKSVFDIGYKLNYNFNNKLTKIPRVPIIPSLDSTKIYKRVKKYGKKIDIGYRHRHWDTVTVEDILKGFKTSTKNKKRKKRYSIF